MDRENETQVSIWLPDELIKKLDERATKDRRNRKDTIIILLEKTLKEGKR